MVVVVVVVVVVAVAPDLNLILLVTPSSLSSCSTTNTTRNNNSSLNLSKLPNDIWSCIAPQLHVIDWYNMTKTSADLNDRLTNRQFMNDVKFGNNGFDVNGGPDECRTFHFQLGSEINVRFRKSKGRRVFIFTCQLTHNRIIYFSYKMNRDRVIYVYVQWSDSQDELEDHRYVNYVVVYNHHHMDFMTLMFNSIASCSLTRFIIHDKYRINIDIYCSNMEIYCCRPKNMKNIRRIKRLHSKECYCSTTSPNRPYTNKFSAHAGTDPTGISILPDNQKDWIDIPHNQVHTSIVATLPWFWPWYNSNDLSLLHSLEFEDETFGLKTQVILTRRKENTNYYCFQVKMNES